MPQERGRSLRTAVSITAVVGAPARAFLLLSASFERWFVLVPTRTSTTATLGTITHGTRKARLAVAVQYATTTVPASTASRRIRARVSSGATMPKKRDAAGARNERVAVTRLQLGRR